MPESDLERLLGPHGLLAYLGAKTGSGEDTPTLLVAKAFGEIRVDVAARWGGAAGCSLESFANLALTAEGGTHARGLILGLVDGLRYRAPSACAGRTLKQLEAALSRGLTAVVCVRLDNPAYDTPTKSRLTTPSAKAAVKNCVAEGFAALLSKERSLLERFSAAMD